MVEYVVFRMGRQSNELNHWTRLESSIWRWLSPFSSDGLSPKKLSLGQYRDLKVELKPSPSPGSSKKFDFEH